MSTLATLSLSVFSTISAPGKFPIAVRFQPQISAASLGEGGADSSTINFLRPTAFPGHTGFLSAATDYLCKRYCQDRAALRVVPARRERAVVRAGLSPLAWPFLLSDWVQKKWGATAEESASHRQPVPTKALDANSFIAVWLAPATAPISFRFVGYRNRCESNHCG
jgi:hypothetical protein